MKNHRKGFTLIELLIVIGILAILAVTVLLTLNPGEAQKKNRDLKRVKDATTLQAIIDQYLNDGNSLTGSCLISGTGCNSEMAGGGLAPQACANNWLSINTCAYAQTVPVDPNNGQSRSFVTGASGTVLANAQYLTIVNGSNYEINVRQEAEGNRSKVTADGGNHVGFFEIGNGPLTLLN